MQHRKWGMLWGALLLAVLSSSCRSAPAARYDIVLHGGRVLDPESGLDAVRDVGINGNRIAAISEKPLDGSVVVDVKGQAVAPGFIDLHAHGQTLSDNQWQAQDGVTTALEMETGAWPIDEWYANRARSGLLNYGATVGHAPARIAYITGARKLDEINQIRRATDNLAPEWSHRRLEPPGSDSLAALISTGLDQGGLGIGVGINYTPAASPQEILRLFELAAERKVPIHVHMRAIGLGNPGSVSSIQEVLADALFTGARLHIVHLGSSGLREGVLLAQMVDSARRRGLDVTGEVYPYTAGSTLLQSAMFETGWRERLGIDYGDLQWPPTNERLTEASFNRYRKVGGYVILHMIPEGTVDSLVARSGVMIASDGVPIVNGRGHPREVGTYSRVLGRYVREKKVLSLMEAMRKMSYLPAEWLRPSVPAMARKGRIKVGADADLVVFDPERVIDRATFENPAQASAGINHVLVNGTFVVRDGALVSNVLPGRPVRTTEP